METETEEKEVAADWWFLAVDQTEDWNLPLLPHHEHIERIMTVMQFDLNRLVHCCDITPSYECWPVQYLVIFKDQEALSEREFERIRELVEQEVNALHYSEGVTYYHVSYLEQRMQRVAVPSKPEKPKRPPALFGMDFVTGWAFAHYGETGVPLKDTNDDLEQAYAEQRETVLEWYHQREIF